MWPGIFSIQIPVIPCPFQSCSMLLHTVSQPQPQPCRIMPASLRSASKTPKLPIRLCTKGLAARYACSSSSFGATSWGKGGKGSPRSTSKFRKAEICQIEMGAEMFLGSICRTQLFYLFCMAILAVKHHGNHQTLNVCTPKAVLQQDQSVMRSIRRTCPNAMGS